VTTPPAAAIIYATTDLGRTREHNEDAFLVADLTQGRSSLHSETRTLPIGSRGLLLLVADGMGGAAAGELASAMAADLIYGHLAGTWSKEAEDSPDHFILRLREAVELANLQIHNYAKGHPEVRGMGTTATVAGILANHLFLAQVGDSRAYLLRGGRAVQVTKDQSLTQRLVDAGELSEEEAAVSTRRNIILQALGPDPKIKVELTHLPLSRGDVLVLCSDGLSNQVRRDEIAAMAEAQTELETLGSDLVTLANSRGGPDNITVVLARFEGQTLPSPEDAAEPAYSVLADDEATEDDIVTAELPAAVAPPNAGATLPARRSGAPTGMAMLVAGVILVLLAIFLALG
jgi:protein phosphatase